MGKLNLTDPSKGIKTVQNKTEKSSIPTLIAITAVSSCLMLAAVGTYRLTSDAPKERSTASGEETVTEDVEANAE